MLRPRVCPPRSWVILASWLTFSGPFKFTGNGYFCSWVGMLCSLILMLSACFPDLMKKPLTAQVAGLLDARLLDLNCMISY